MSAKDGRTPTRLLRRAMSQTIAAVHLTKEVYELEGQPDELEEIRAHLSKGFDLLNQARSKRLAEAKQRRERERERSEERAEV